MVIARGRGLGATLGGHIASDATSEMLLTRHGSSVVHRFTAVTLGALLVGMASGCQRQSGMDALLGDRARTPAPASTGSCDFNLEGAAGETVFFVLGMLDEYLGRGVVEDSDVIEGFYCNEAAMAATFREAIQKLATEQRLDPSSIKTETRQDCLISFHAKALADRLNSCYVFQTGTKEGLVQAADGTYRRTAKGSLGLSLFLRDGQGTAEGFYRERALAYLSGAWTRYGRDSAFVFANSDQKARLVAELLQQLGCRGVWVESNVGFIPRTNRVRFEPTDEVKERLNGGTGAALPNIGLQPSAAVRPRAAAAETGRSPTRMHDTTDEHTRWDLSSSGMRRKGGSTTSSTGCASRRRSPCFGTRRQDSSTIQTIRIRKTE